nr:MAG TPA: replication initiator protein [Caudoviricetes sp.]
MAIIKTNINEVEEVFAKMDLALICEERYNSLKQFDWVVYTILKNQEGLSKRSYLMGNKSYVDKYNNVFVRISQKKLAKLLKTSIPTLRNSLNRLVEAELLEIHIVGQNECNIMYIGNPVRTITFGEYVENIGKALEDEDNVKDFKPSINVDNIKDLDNKKASTVPPVKADKENIKSNNSIPQNNKKYASKKEENKVLNNKHNNTVKNTFTEYEAKELEIKLQKSQWERLGYSQFEANYPINKEIGDV